jgi:hypothetical protein
MQGMKLALFDDHVSWCDTYDRYDGEGGTVGQDRSCPLATLQSRLAEAKSAREWDEYEYLAVEIAARNWCAHPGVAGQVQGKVHGYVFDSEALAKRFLVAMRAAAKVARIEFDSDVEWPEWARAALAAGWKPPKGWKP